ncbi:MAG: gliding motility-associated C-terminal domain-containing protein, partial [Cyclobacteriaceae bacterium]|nr:gliding motility-associated C-terminal domain-containing protein [Cyclobacteriaceae bacterium]
LMDNRSCTYHLETRILMNRTLYIPNIFTPNGDGVNDTFLIRNLPPNATVIISNRWGVQVYESENYQNDWDGKDVSDGIFFYRVVINEEVTRGWVEIQRGIKPGG